MSFQDETDGWVIKIEHVKVERITLSIDRELAREILKIADAACVLECVVNIRPLLDQILKAWPDLASEYSWLF